ncbi:5-hydroxytryptamine receptor 3A-like [Salminus brasiliensis]|uniref:5-hydroxytryptamine receptor 3A-like n=1 Tax=Salminus brasiliensis TaxID=930266 RepID=UPI003B82D828
MAALLIYGFCLLLLTVHEAFPKRVCAPQDVLDYLNLTRNNEKFATTRPVRDWRRPTEVRLDACLSAILSVTWNNELISWNPEDFCGITQVSLPREMLWIPDLAIYELAEQENSPPSPYLYITHNGEVSMEEDLRIVSTCKMDVRKFPFDTQSCQMTISPILHSSDEIKLKATSNSSKTTQRSKQFMMTQGEWELLDMTVTEDNFTFSDLGTWDMIRYTITVRRMPLLHVLNFQVPVLFFLVLDLASFFIPDTKGEKLSFKVTVLLAISVLLLILNDILPSKSDQCPLMATYIIFIFALMLLSLLETILVTYLIDMDSASEEQVRVNTKKSSSCSLKPEIFITQHETTTSEKDEKKRQGSESHTSSGVNSPSASLTGVALGGAEAMADLHLLQLIVEQLQALRENMRALEPRAQGGGGYWSRVAKRINAAFFVFYISVTALFLTLISVEWIE